MHFVIIGNGVAGTSAAFEIRSRHRSKKIRITLISDESDYFFSRTALMYAYMDRLSREDLEPFERKVYARQSIERIRDRVVNLDANEQTLQLMSGKTLSYDRLLIATGAKPRSLPFPGIQDVRDGIVNFVSIQDLDECERLTWSTEKAVVVGGGLIGIELVESLRHHKIDVTFLVREPYFWPMALAAEEGQLVSDHIRSHGVDLRHDEQIVQLKADTHGRIASVSTDQDNEFACQMLGICVGVQANINWLQDVNTPPDMDRGLLVDRAFKTSLPNVFAAGDCTEIIISEQSTLLETIWYSAKLHGEMAARSMMGDHVNYRPPIFYNSSKFFDVEFTTVGQVIDPPEGSRALFRKDPKKLITQRIVYNEQQVIGFNMLGSRWDHTVLQRWIAQRRDIEFVRNHLHEAQFDFEFGRAKLHNMDEVEVEL